MSHETGTHQKERSGHPAPMQLVGVGVDGQAEGRDAIVLGSMLARATGASLMLIAVNVEPTYTLGPLEGYDLPSMRKLTRARLIEARDSLAPEARIEVPSDVLIWRGLRHAVRKTHADLLVVGSSQRAPEGHVRIGRWAAELESHLGRPLAIAPRGMHGRSNARLERIGAGFDGRPESRAAVELAESLAASAGAELEVCEATGGHKPVDALCGLCERVDLVVIGSGRRGPRGRLAFGATGRALLKDAPAPIVIAPRPVD